MLIRKFITIILLSGFFITNSYSQSIDTTNVLAIDSIELKKVKAEKKPSKMLSFFKLFSGKPGRAALYSLLIPSGGQIYNRNIWKVPVVLGTEAALGYYVYVESINYRDWKQAYIDIKSGEITSYSGITDPLFIKNIRDDYRYRKERIIVFTSIFHLLTVIDAYAERHLMDFNMDENLSINIKHELIQQDILPKTDLVSLSLTYKF